MEEKIISVSQLTQAIKSVLEEGFGDVTVSGEISNFKAHSSGHRYFTLKDEGAAISCVMWRGRNLTFAPTDGMKVVARGRLSVYPPRGNYQLDCFSLSPQGQGDLFLAFEALKKKLGEAGYFAPERKRALPALPMKIGVATSPTGAAVRDIMSTIERRFPAANIYFRPAIVQGDEAGPDVALSIRELAATNADIIIIGRGGGSLEDLWAFNTEIVADAIFKCPVPVISAVGHETDFTIADFTADVRAATPTAAAELATPTPAAELIRGIAQYQQLMTSNISNKIALHKDAVAMLLRRRAERR
ncbi:MAG: exodeoxyribonuclease VII large subunit, partial [Candidatus Kapaibacterium sp.]